MRTTLIFYALFLIGISAESQNTNEAVVCNDRLYFMYPTKTKAHLNEGLILFQEGEKSVVMSFSCATSTSSDSDFRNSRISEIKSKNPDFKLILDSTIIVDEREGSQFIYTTGSKGSEIIVSRNDARYTFGLVSNDKKLFDKYYPEFLKIINSVEFLEYGIGNCNVARMGKFVYTAFPSTAYIEINGDQHLEFHNNESRSIYNKIVWLNDCEYNIVFDHTDKPEGWSFKKGDIINVKILSATDNRYRYVWTYKNNKGINELQLVLRRD